MVTTQQLNTRPILEHPVAEVKKKNDLVTSERVPTADKAFPLILRVRVLTGQAAPCDKPDVSLKVEYQCFTRHFHTLCKHSLY